jgi:hypothetical protein
MLDIQAIREAVAQYREEFHARALEHKRESNLEPAFKALLEKAGFADIKKRGRCDLYWSSHSGSELVIELKSPKSSEFNPDLPNPQKQGYIHTDSGGYPKTDQEADGVAQLHLYCRELRVRYGLFSNGKRLLVYDHKEPFGERCLSGPGEKCNFPKSRILETNLLTDEIDTLAVRLARMQNIIECPSESHTGR